MAYVGSDTRCIVCNTVIGVHNNPMGSIGDICVDCALKNTEGMFAKCRECSNVVWVESKRFDRLGFIEENLRENNLMAENILFTRFGFVLGIESCPLCSDGIEHFN